MSHPQEIPSGQLMELQIRISELEVEAQRVPTLESRILKQQQKIQELTARIAELESQLNNS